MQANAADKREKTKEYFKGLADMNRRVSRRKMLFEQATQDNLRRQVLEKFDEVRLHCMPLMVGTHFAALETHPYFLCRRYLLLVCRR
jgi:hypothetical protein